MTDEIENKFRAQYWEDLYDISNKVVTKYDLKYMGSYLCHDSARIFELAIENLISLDIGAMFIVARCDRIFIQEPIYIDHETPYMAARVAILKCLLELHRQKEYQNKHTN